MKRISQQLGIIVALMLLATLPAHAQKKSSKKQVNQVSINTHNGVPDISSGFWNAITEDGAVQIQVMNKNRRNHSSFLIYFDADPSELVSDASGNTLIRRDAGTLTLKGAYDGDEGTGSFTFERNGSFESFLENQGISARGEEAYYFFKLFLGDVNQNYVRQIKALNYNPSLNELAKLGIHDVDIDFINFLQGTHYKDLELGMIVKFAIHGIREGYIRGLAKAGYGTIEANMVKNLAIHGVSIKYLDGLKAQGYGDMDARMVKNFAVHGISIDYLKGLKDHGYGNMEPSMVKNFAVHGVSVNYLKSLKEAGYGDLEPYMVKKFAVHGVSSSYIESLLGAEIDKPTPQQIQKAKIHGVSAKFIAKAKRQGHKSQDLTDYTKWKIRGI